MFFRNILIQASIKNRQVLNQRDHSKRKLTHHESSRVDFGQTPSAQRFGGHPPKMQKPVNGLEGNKYAGCIKISPFPFWPLQLKILEEMTAKKTNFINGLFLT